MKPADELKKLSSLLERFTIQIENSDVVDRGSLNILYDQASAMRIYAEKKKKQKQIQWTFIIDSNKSITFREAETCSGIKPDIFCTMSFTLNEMIKLTRLNTVIRLWSTTQDRAYRISFDSHTIEKQLEASGWRRVILRMHFDYLPVSELAAPKFHMQFGGRPNDSSECNWFPSDIDVPRLLCLPVDFFGACEIVLANFFPSTYFNIGKEHSWIKSIKWCEERLTHDELLHHLKSVNSSESIFRRSLYDKRNT